MSSSGDEEDCMIKLDTNIEIETIVRNVFEEIEDPADSKFPIISVLPASLFKESGATSGEKPEDQWDEIEIEIDTKEYDWSLCGSDYESTSSARSEDSYTSSDRSVDEESKTKDSCSKEEKVRIPSPRFKDVNTKELIVFCVDMSTDMENVPFTISDENNPWIAENWDTISNSMKTKVTEHTPLSMVKRVIGMFVYNKHFIDKKHQFALMVLYETATWVSEFTSNPKELIDTLERLTETRDCKTCDLASVAIITAQKYPFVLSKYFEFGDVHSVYRVILIYGRSNCLIEFSNPSILSIFTNFPSMYLDILYLHEPNSDQNKCEEIFVQLCNLDTGNKSFIFEVGRSTTKLHNAMGKLLSHPLQRVSQKEADYELQHILPICQESW